MKFSVGERIIIKEDGTVAEVISIISSKIVEVLTEYGNEVTVLVKDIDYPKGKDPFPVQKDNTKEVIQSKVQVPAIPKELSQGFYFSFQPVYAVGEDEIVALKLHFINRTHVAVILEFSATLDNKEAFLQKLIVLPSGKAELASIPFEQLNGKPKFHYNICALKEKTDWVEGNWFQFNNHIGLTPKKLFAYLNKIEAEKATSFELFLAAPKETTKKTTAPSGSNLEPPKKKQTLSQKTKNVSKKTQSFNEIDLHTESLNIPTERLGNFAILTKQLQALENAIDKAVMRGQTSLIIIHGVGKGKLKEEVHHLLKGNPQVTFFQYSWRPKYGWGATEAFFYAAIK